MTITTEQILAAGCDIQGLFAYDITDNKCVARLIGDGIWELWRIENWPKNKRRFRVKAITMRSEG